MVVEAGDITIDENVALKRDQVGNTFSAHVTRNVVVDGAVAIPVGAPAEVVLRLLILKHVRNWSYEVLEREVRANLVYRDFTAWVARRCRTPRPWGAGDWRWRRK